MDCSQVQCGCSHPILQGKSLIVWIQAVPYHLALVSGSSFRHTSFSSVGIAFGSKPPSCHQSSMSLKIQFWKRNPSHTNKCVVCFFFSFLFVPEISGLFPFLNTFFFSSRSYYYAVSKSHIEVLDFALSLLGDLFNDGKGSAKAEKRV